MACPICNKEAVPEYRPFCSKGCSDVDLHRWLTGSYTIDEKGEISHNTDIHDENVVLDED